MGLSHRERPIRRSTASSGRYSLRDHGGFVDKIVHIKFNLDDVILIVFEHDFLAEKHFHFNEKFRLQVHRAWVEQT